MTPFSRREFGRRVIAAAPLALVSRSIDMGATAPVTVGVTTSSFRDLPRVKGKDNVDDVIRALKAVGATHVELALANIEPAPPSTAPFLGGSPAYPVRVVLTPEQIAATNAAYRTELRSWRLTTGLGEIERIGARFTGAGLTVQACTLAFDESFTDDELDATFNQVRALGASVVSSPLTMAAAARLAPFAERHRIPVAIHNQMDGNRTSAIATKDLDAALALSARFSLKLDVGNLTASNQDAVGVLRSHLPRVSYVLLKDRLRNGGTSQHFGEGDTPITAVMKLLGGSASGIPAMVEYDYPGLRSSIDELRESLAYLQG